LPGLRGAIYLAQPKRLGLRGSRLRDPRRFHVSWFGCRMAGFANFILWRQAKNMKDAHDGAGSSSIGQSG
jgi:hypothetical protein